MAPLSQPSLLPNQATGAATSLQGDKSFQNLLVESIDHVNQMQLDANKAVESLMTGGDVNPAEVLTSLQKADLSLRMMLQIRNKLVQAYQEVKDIRV